MLFSPREKRKRLHTARNWVWPDSGVLRAWRYHWLRLMRITASPHEIALGLATGVFMGFSPLVGFHIVTAALICFFTGGSVLAAALGTMVCNPVTCPVMLLGDFKIGSALLGEKHHAMLANLHLPEGGLVAALTNPAEFWHVFWHALGPVFLPLLTGGAILGLAFAVPSYFLTRRGVERLRAAAQKRRMLKEARP